MKTPLPILAFMFLLLLPLLGQAQETRISGHLIDAVTKDPIPFASLGLLKEDVGALSNEFGYFQFTGLRKHGQDSLIVMTLGYTRRAVFVGSGATQKLLVELNRQPYVIGGPNISTHCKVAKEQLSAEEVLAEQPGTQYAFFVNNEKREGPDKIRAVAFYIGEYGFPKKEFRIRIYKADGNTHSPYTNLLNEPVFLVAPKDEKWYFIDLSRYEITAPKDGYFVAVEFGAFRESHSPIHHMNRYFPSGQIIRPPFQSNKQRVWTRVNDAWKRVSSGNYDRYNAMIRVEVDTVE